MHWFDEAMRLSNASGQSAVRRSRLCQRMLSERSTGTHSRATNRCGWVARPDALGRAWLDVLSDCRPRPSKTQGRATRASIANVANPDVFYRVCNTEELSPFIKGWPAGAAPTRTQFHPITVREATASSELPPGFPESRRRRPTSSRLQPVRRPSPGCRPERRCRTSRTGAQSPE